MVAGMGTSGTLLGAGRYLKERKPDVKLIAADPMGSVYYNYMTRGEAKAEGSSVLEGAGIGRLPGIFNKEEIDEIVRVTDPEAMASMRQIIRREGLFVGGTSGLSVAGAVKVARSMGPGRTIITVLCDSGRNYMSKIFNEAWMKAQGLAEP
jgi:cysteine synthase A